MMKRTSPWIELCAVAAMVVSANAWADRGGGSEGNGGDAYCAKWVEVADMLLDNLRLLTPEELGATDLGPLEEAVKTTHLESVLSPLKLGDTEVDAINIPQKKLIKFNRARWDSIKDMATRYNLVLHEYFGIIGVNDTNYRISAKIIVELSYLGGQRPPSN